MSCVTWNRYRVDREPGGRGNHSRIHFGVDLETGRPVAIKRIRSATQAEREATVMRACGTHPNLVEFVDFFVRDKKGYIVMERVVGTPIGYGRRARRRPQAHAVRVTIGVLHGLARLHQVGYLHCDLAPQNVLIASDGDPDSVKVIDFTSSVAKDGDGLYRGGRKRGGTDGYMPPEQLRGGALNDSSDVFAAACLCYCLLTGRAPKSGASFAKIEDAGLRQVLQTAARRDPEYRYASAEAFVSALKAFC